MCLLTTIRASLSIAAILFAAGLLGATPILAFDIIQITDNDTGDHSPAISGSNVVWVCRPGICLWDGSSITQITDDDVPGRYPDISGSNVVWMGYDGSDYEIYFWDGLSAINISNNDLWDMHPAISGSNVVWQACDGQFLPFPYDFCFGDWEIYLWDGSTVTQITDNDLHDEHPDISGSNVVWECGDGHDPEICLWGGSSITQITDNDFSDVHPAISGSNVAWQSTVWRPGQGINDEIYLWDGSSTTRITDSYQEDDSPAISGSNVVWSRWYANRTDNCLWDGSSITVIVPFDTEPGAPDISGPNVVWRACDSGADCTFEGDSEIYMMTIPGLITAVEIDIKPGSDPNSINTDDKGVIPVAILTTEDFDALAFDADSVRFGPDEAEKRHKRAHVEDVDGDGDLDLLLHFRTQDTGIAAGDTEACVTGQTYDGMPIMGCDSVRTVPPN